MDASIGCLRCTSPPNSYPWCPILSVHPGRSAAGFTLIEVLVTLVLLVSIALALVAARLLKPAGENEED